MLTKKILESITPPALWSLLRNARRRLTGTVDGLTYAPRGWATQLPSGSGSEAAWAKFTAYAANEPNSSAAIGQSIPDMACIYVFALAALLKAKPKILDYGGHLGDSYWVSKAFLPDVELEYHCKEFPSVAELGRRHCPAAIWHSEDSCLSESYDVVMFSGVLQYVPDWQDLLCRAASAAGPYLFLSQVSTVENVPGYVAVQRMRGITLLHQQLNKADLLATVQGTGLSLVREFMSLEHPFILSAPEQPRYRAWLFQRDAKPGHPGSRHE